MECTKTLTMFIKQLLTASFLLFALTSSADIVIRGEIREVEEGSGFTSIRCKGRRGECIRIQTGPRIAELVDKGTVTARYSFAEYKSDPVLIEGEESTSVKLIGTKKL